MFVAGHYESAIQAIDPDDDRFEWHNYHDKDDVLGWPLRVLSRSYRDLARISHQGPR